MHSPESFRLKHLNVSFASNKIIEWESGSSLLGLSPIPSKINSKINPFVFFPQDFICEAFDYIRHVTCDFTLSEIFVAAHAFIIKL